MKKLIYKKKVKIILALLQTAAVGILVYCLLNIGFWMENSYSLEEMSKSFEESELFFRQVDIIVQNKIRAQQNNILFETDGEFDEAKEIDIQSYGVSGSSVQDLNTTYRLGDLLDFSGNGDLKRLQAALAEATVQEGADSTAGEWLAERSDELETITPVTGILLSECSRWYSDPAEYVLEMYTLLADSCEDIYSRYLEYTESQEESWSRNAPSNLRYCVEDTTTGALYTNTGAEDYKAAVASVQADPALAILYEGERSFNIMVTNSDNVLNQAAADWFMSERFVNTNEKVFLAVDTAYPVSDELQAFSVIYSKRESIVWISFFCAVICGIVLLVCFALSLFGAGWKQEGVMSAPDLIDRVPTELAAMIYLIIAGLYLLIFYEKILVPSNIPGRERVFVAAAVAFAWMVFLSGCVSLVKRVRMQTLWSNSICRMLVRTWRRVTAARAASGQFLILYIVFFILNFLFMLLGRAGLFLMFLMDMVVLLYLLRDMAGKQSIYEGIQQISKGDLKYKIDTAYLQGETFEMAKAVNEMGDGLQEAVEAIVKNERLKAELITNVSHDIKTPLTSIVNYVDLLKRENLQGERVQHYIEVLDQKSQRLKQLTEDLVEASKISSGNIELEMVRMQLQSMIRQAYGEFQERLEERALEPVWNLDREPVCIMADGRQIWRVLENLLGNIYKYAMEGTRIYIDLHRTDQKVSLSIANISKERLTLDAEELAGRFVRGDKSRSTEGSGLGLSIAQNLTQLQGGTFSLEIDGDLFRVTMVYPVAEDE